MEENYRQCVQCVMDTTDPGISFDELGICNHCRTWATASAEKVVKAKRGQRELESLATAIRRAGRKKKFDCILGVSGGVDSTYAALVIKKLELRPLAVHFDNGWNSELANKNIEFMVKKLGFELYTYVVNWEEFRNLQVSFLKASTPDSEIPTDHAVHSLLYLMARKFGIRYIISGENINTETHLPSGWSQGHWDWKYIKSVQKRFGSVPLKTMPHLSLVKLQAYQLYYKWIDVLNYVDYNKFVAMAVLAKELGWQYYGGKHYESIYTRFYQGFILPRKFGFDKRKSHLSSAICSGQISRAEALRELQTPTYATELQKQDRQYVIKKLKLTDAEFEEIMRAPPKSMFDYECYATFYRSSNSNLFRLLYRRIKKIARVLDRWHHGNA